MKSTPIPLICGIALSAMSAAGLSHWWSVRQFIAAVDAGLPVSATTPRASQPGKQSPAPQTAATVAKQTTQPAPDASQRKFYDALISRMESLQNQNRDLLDQLAETNRDLMKLEFRVDTHSESFRPLPVTEDRPFTSLDSEIGVLPPRAEPVSPPMHE
jgi:predicted RNase H-like nuclease (RuvC/YqgF family)